MTWFSFSLAFVRGFRVRLLIKWHQLRYHGGSHEWEFPISVSFHKITHWIGVELEFEAMSHRGIPARFAPVTRLSIGVKI